MTREERVRLYSSFEASCLSISRIFPVLCGFLFLYLFILSLVKFSLIFYKLFIYILYCFPSYSKSFVSCQIKLNRCIPSVLKKVTKNFQNLFFLMIILLYEIKAISLQCCWIMNLAPIAFLPCCVSSFPSVA